MGGRLDEAVETVEASLPVALELGDEAMVAVFELVLVGLWARLYRGDLRDAEQRALAVRELAGDTATAEGRALLGGVAARSMLWQGRVTAAIDLLRDGTIGHEEPSTLGFRPLLHTTLAVALVAAGQPGGDAEVAAARSLWKPPRLFDADLGVAAAHVAAAEGHTRVAVALADEAAIEAAAKGNRLFGLLAAHTANGIAPDDDRRSRLVELAADVEGPLAALLRRQAELSERSDPAEADRVADGFLALGANHQALLTSAAAVGWHRRRVPRCRGASHGAATRALADCPGLAHTSGASLRTRPTASRSASARSRPSPHGAGPAPPSPTSSACRSAPSRATSTGPSASSGSPAAPSSRPRSRADHAAGGAARDARRPTMAPRAGGRNPRRPCPSSSVG